MSAKKKGSEASGESKDSPAPSAEPKCEECERLNEPCSPDCYEKAGNPREHFADFVRDLRFKREQAASGDADADHAARIEREEAAARDAEAKALAINARAAASAASKPAPKRAAKPKDGHVFVTVTEHAGRVGYDGEEYVVGETFEMIEHTAAGLVKLNVLRHAD